MTLYIIISMDKFNRIPPQEEYKNIESFEVDTTVLGSRFYEDWLPRNGEWAPDEQKLPFDESSIEGQEKDIDQNHTAREVFFGKTK